jgi:hypothetical protein
MVGVARATRGARVANQRIGYIEHPMQFYAQRYYLPYPLGKMEPANSPAGAMIQMNPRSNSPNPLQIYRGRCHIFDQENSCKTLRIR